MGVVSLLVGGSVIYAGVRALLKQRRRQSFVWLKNPDGQSVRTTLTVVEPEDPARSERLAERSYTLATVSLGLTVAGYLFFGPLVLVGVPFTIYNLVVMLEPSFMTLLEHGRISLVAFGSVLVIGTLLTEQFLGASLIQWFYFLGHRLALVFEKTNQQSVIAIFQENPQMVWIFVREGGFPPGFDPTGKTYPQE